MIIIIVIIIVLISLATEVMMIIMINGDAYINNTTPMAVNNVIIHSVDTSSMLIV